ncbi:hypothetical protein A3C75_02545 [Candidatus Giovannonibacteria bacterium RIFCSPHIGHO2_02_FULL_44_31]|nr:MAG: hypothetical protein A3C75_02545 [Candidatus Giovannonibacteria bacterium RIFCSPHIGHO2_02_FULL_44_31]OGF77008.1 MAG: hypothetical protein A3E62_02060 [Candidatus Giovannonibacteria bacterium RIFCSPHIGHO2_12_FULL_44_29]
MEKETKKILVVGGGFGGISAALALEEEKIPNAKILLVSDKPHFEYKPALYRVVTGRSPLEVCIPIKEIFEKKNIAFMVDLIKSIDFLKKVARGASGTDYQFDYLVLALGSESAYFDIPGLEKFSFGFKSISEAMRLKMHLHNLFAECKDAKDNLDKKICLLQVVVVGAGPSGVELAGELALFMKRLSKEYEVDQSLISVDLIEAAPRILPALPERLSIKIAHRLRHIGVNIFTNRAMTKEEMEQISIRGMTMKTETVIWTAGVKPNFLYKNVNSLLLDQRGRVIVDEFLRAKGFENVFVVGDGAATENSGMAQTAIYDGQAVAENISCLITNKPLKTYQQKRVYYALPVGPGWAAVSLGFATFYGSIGWLLRKFADFRYFLSILPLQKAITVFQRGKNLCDTCGICSKS